jgi:hypothetical protein
MAAAEFDCDRLHTVLPKMRKRLSAALNSEQHDRWLEDFKRVRIRRDEAAAMFAGYPELAARLVEIFRLAQEVDREVHRVNHNAPDNEHRRLREAELEARGLESFSRATPSLAKTLQLPDHEQPGKFVWPPREPSLAVQVATGMIQRSHPGADWASEREERTAALREEHARVIDHYDSMARAREEREAAEAVSLAAARRNRS